MTTTELPCSSLKISVGHKNTAKVVIAPALGEKTTACNVGLARKTGHGACMISMSRTNTMQGFIQLLRNALKL